MLKPIKGKIKSTGEVVELEPITNEEFRKKYVWMEKVSGVFYKDSDIEIIPDEKADECECICEQLRKDKDTRIHLENCFYTSLVMSYGWMAAYGEGCAKTDIQYCPFCGKKFE